LAQKSAGKTVGPEVLAILMEYCLKVDRMVEEIITDKRDMCKKLMTGLVYSLGRSPKLSINQRRKSRIDSTIQKFTEPCECIKPEILA